MRQIKIGDIVRIVGTNETGTVDALMNDLVWLDGYPTTQPFTLDDVELADGD